MIGQSKTRLLGVTVLVAVFAVGGLTGAVVRSAVADNSQPRPPQRGPSLFEQLKLTADQQTKVCAVMKNQAEQVKPHEATMQEEWKSIHAIVDATNADIDSLLTPEQRATKDQFRAERNKYFQQRQAEQQKAHQNDANKAPNKDPRRGSRPSPGNPLGIICPGLNDGSQRGPGGPGGPHGPWGGDSSRDGKAHTPTAAKPKEI